jgi:hypothetical protein
VPKSNCPCNLLPLILHKLKPGKRDTHDLGAASRKRVRLCKSVENLAPSAHDCGLAGETPVLQRSTTHAGLLLAHSYRIRGYGFIALTLALGLVIPVVAKDERPAGCLTPLKVYRKGKRMSSIFPAAAGLGSAVVVKLSR